MTGRRLSLTAKAFRELGPRQLWEYSRYRGMLHLGILRRQTASPPPPVSAGHLQFSPDPIFVLPDRSQIVSLLGDLGMAQVRGLADEIAAGKVRLFGGDAVPLRLGSDLPLAHWTEYELGKIDTRAVDYKQIWEHGRFGWGISLARAYHLTGDEHFADVFWRYTRQFLQANPANLGVHWVSAQEVALRLIALAFCYQVLRPLCTPPPSMPPCWRAPLPPMPGAFLPACHTPAPRTTTTSSARRPVCTLLVSSCPPTLEQRPGADKGWRWLNRALQAQIAEDGAYVQHSANYQRLILQTGLWVALISGNAGQSLPEATRQRLAASTRWLLTLLDSPSGNVPNLGPNDGACLFPLSGFPFEDYRPLLQAASTAFLDQTPLAAGAWDEMRLWLCAGSPSSRQVLTASRAPVLAPDQSPHRLDHPGSSSWAYMRVASFSSRPGHADQLHLDLWWRGYNLAQDAGSYLYNDPPPWDNALQRSGVHNTLTVDGLDQMTLAGRFLWLHWAQAQLVEHAGGNGAGWERLVARHDGYQRLGMFHQRSVTCFLDGHWLVDDNLLPVATASQPKQVHSARLHWLLPDWPWQLDSDIENAQLTLTSPTGPINITICCWAEGTPPGQVTVSLARAGELIAGSGVVEPTRGWSSITYAHKIPALSLAVVQTGRVPLHFTSEWRLH